MSTQITLDKQKPLRFRKDLKVNSLKECIKLLLFDKENTYREGKNNRAYQISKYHTHRSAEDIYLLCKNYNIDVTLEHVRTVIKETNTKKYCIEGHYCGTCGRHVHAGIVSWGGTYGNIIRIPKTDVYIDSFPNDKDVKAT